MESDIAICNAMGSSSTFDCSSIMHLKEWRIGQSQALQPRILHSTDNIVILVAAQYCCEHGHVTCCTDPRLSHDINDHLIPFVLLHRTGFTTDFVHTVIELMHEGLTARGIERFIEGRRRQFASTLMMQIISALSTPEDLRRDTIESLEKSDQIRCMQSPIPSNDVIRKCVLVDFMQLKDYYNSEMYYLPIGTHISIDHTFKVAANIGYRRSDKKWVTLYNSLFIILNQFGQIISWQLTSSTSFDEVDDLLSDMKQRISQPTVVFVDNCCAQRSKLKNSLGQDITVSLDVFHAIQRITKTIPKRHPLFTQCSADLRLVFRSPDDLGDVRQQSTPSSVQLMENLNSFIRKWSNCECNGWKIINSKTLFQINALKVHISKGCLSNMVVGGGTNKNEALHRHINPHFNRRNKLGLPLALALLTILFHQYNSKKLDKNTPQRRSVYLKQYLSSGSNNPPSTFGILRKEHIPSNLTWVISKSSTKTLQNAQLVEETLLSDDVTITACKDIISVDEAIKLLQNSLNITTVALYMQKASQNSPILNYRYMPFMSCVTNVIFHKLEGNMQSRQDLDDGNKLDNLLKSWGMKRHCVAGDGNCFFAAMALGLINDKSKYTEYKPDFFTSLGLHEPFDVTALSRKLRILAVQEWKSHASDYEGFIKNLSILEEADKFMQDGYFDSALGDTVVLALSNALCLPIFVFSSIDHYPVINVTPRNIVIPVPVFIAYNQYGSGHYDGVVFGLDHPIPISSSLTINKCNCGKNDKTGVQTSCLPRESKYTTVIRCPCYKSERACTKLCTCKKCANPYGAHERVLGPTKSSRKRQRHMWQVSMPKSSIFALDAGEKVTAGPRSILEFFALEQTVKFCSEEGIDASSNNILVIYNTLVEVSRQIESEKDLQLGMKTAADIETFLNEHDHLINTFQSLCIGMLATQFI